MKSIDELMAVLPPPPAPRGVMSDSEWLSLFEKFGTRLPQEFVQFDAHYGNGCISSLSHPMSASIEIYHGKRFAVQVPRRLTELRLAKEHRPKSFPFPLYWEPNGLLPWGCTTNGSDLCWRVQGKLVDNWKVVVVRVASRAHEEYDLKMAGFLRAVILGSSGSSLMPVGLPGAKGVAFEPWPWGS